MIDNGADADAIAPGVEVDDDEAVWTVAVELIGTISATVVAANSVDTLGDSAIAVVAVAIGAVVVMSFATVDGGT